MNIELEHNCKSVGDVADYIKNVTAYMDSLFKINERSCRVNIVNINDAIIKEIDRFRITIRSNNKVNNGSRITVALKSYIRITIDRLGYVEGDFLKEILDIYGIYSATGIMDIIELIDHHNVMIKPCRNNEVHSITSLKQYYLKQLPHITDELSQDGELSDIMFDIVNLNDIRFTTDAHLFSSPEIETKAIVHNMPMFDLTAYLDNDNIDIVKTIKRLEEVPLIQRYILEENIHNLIAYSLQTDPYFIRNMTRKYEDTRFIEQWLVPIVKNLLLSGNITEDVIDRVYMDIVDRYDRCDANVMSALRNALREDRRYKKINMNRKLTH